MMYPGTCFMAPLQTTQNSSVEVHHVTEIVTSAHWITILIIYRNKIICNIFHVLRKFKWILRWNWYSWVIFCWTLCIPVILYSLKENYQYHRRFFGVWYTYKNPKYYLFHLQQNNFHTSYLLTRFFENSFIIHSSTQDNLNPTCYICHGRFLLFQCQASFHI